MLYTTTTGAATQVLVDPQAITHNVCALEARLGKNGQLMPMIKSDGYGVGALTLHTILSGLGISRYALATVHEALQLRETDVNDTLFVTACSPDEVRLAVSLNVELGVGQASMLWHLARVAKELQTQVAVHIHVNTGMNRFGCRPEEVTTLALAAQELAPWVEIVGIMTHLACADEPEEDRFSEEQLRLFQQAVKQLPAVRWRHVANSATLMRFQLPECNLARPGLAILGYHPSAATRHVPLKPAVTAKSTIMHINEIPAGESVSYLRRYRAHRDLERVAVIPFGYADGWQRHFSGKGAFKVRGKPAPLIGNVCMNHQMLDVTEIPDAQVGDEVTLFGPDWSLEELCDEIGSIPHELLASLKAMRV